MSCQPHDDDTDPDLALLVDAATVRAVRRELLYALGPLATDRIRDPLADDDARLALDELLGRGRASAARHAWTRLDNALPTTDAPRI